MRGIAELRRLVGRERRWWCGAGHSTTTENACTTPVLPNERFCSVAHMEQELKLHEKVKQEAREIPLIQARREHERSFAQYIADNLAVEAPATWAKCPHCGTRMQVVCEDGRVTEIRPDDPPIGSRYPGRTQITFTYWVAWPLGHVCAREDDDSRAV